MVRKILILLMKGILLIGITIILINDFFPQFILNELLPNKLAAVLMILSFLLFSILPISWERKSEKEELKDSVKSNILMLLYIVALVSILKSFGGTSQVGTPIMLLILLCAFVENIRIVIKIRKLD